MNESPAGADRQSVMQFMTTEHFTLQTARAVANAEISSRLQLYMTTLSSAIIALALVALAREGTGWSSEELARRTEQLSHDVEQLQERLHARTEAMAIELSAFCAEVGAPILNEAGLTMVTPFRVRSRHAQRAAADLRESLGG